jgi:HlyD family secretion protein
MLENTAETTTRRRDTAEAPRPSATTAPGAARREFGNLADVLGTAEMGPPMPVAGRRRRLRWRWLLLLAALAAVASLVPAASRFLQRIGETQATVAAATYTVKRGDLLITVTEEGSLESAENRDVKCEVGGGTSIVWIIEDGKHVAKGAELFRLDKSKLSEDVSAQKIAYEKAQSAAIQSRKEYDAAKIAVSEYTEGTFNKDYSEAESKVAVAQGNLHSAENALQHGERMFRKGYISRLQLEAQKTAIERSKLELEAAQTARNVLKRFTRPKMIQELESKRDGAQAKRDGDKASLVLEEAKLKRLTSQLEKCTVRAPQDGLVIYANERMFYGDRDSEIKPGMKVYDEETILRLPDLTKMRAKVGVHEAKIDQIRVSMRARIRVQDRDFQGSVVSVANRPESTWFFSSSAKKYPVKVRIDGKSEALRPGMTAEVEILVSELKDVVSLPVGAVYEKQGQTYCCVKNGPSLERRNIVLGMSNDKFVEVKEGLNLGEVVVLNPRAALGEKDEPQKQATVDVTSRFGANKGEKTEKAETKSPLKKP